MKKVLLRVEEGFVEDERTFFRGWKEVRLRVKGASFEWCKVSYRRVAA